MANKSFDVVVIGGGPGGYPCAIRLAQLGMKTAVVDRGILGGVCLNVGCIPSKALIKASSLFEEMTHADRFGITTKGVSMDYKKLQTWKASVVKKLTGGIGQLLKAHKVEVIRGEAKFISNTEIEVSGDSKTTVSAEQFVVAVGSSPIELPSFPFDEKIILSSTGALSIDEHVKSVIVVGGGYIGLELGTYLAKLGTEVTILEAEKQFLPTYDKDVSDVVLRALKKRGVKLIMGAMAKSVQGNGAGQKVEVLVDGETRWLTCERIIVTVGRKPNEMAGLEALGVKVDRGFIKVDSQLRTNVPNIFAIGDVAGQPMLAHKATKEGLVAADVISGNSSEVFDAKVIPAVIFCEPELSSVGLNETEVRAQGIEPMVGVFPFGALGKAIAGQHTDGFVKLIGDKSTGLLLGAVIVGEESSALIAECALAIECGLQVEDLALTIHAHPTLPEAVMEAAEVALGHPIHIVPKRPRGVAPAARA